jgi:hypothetical protein
VLHEDGRGAGADAAVGDNSLTGVRDLVGSLAARGEGELIGMGRHDGQSTIESVRAIEETKSTGASCPVLSANEIKHERLRKPVDGKLP